MCSYEKIYEIDRMIDIIDERMNKVINRAFSGAMSATSAQAIIYTLEQERQELEIERDVISNSITF